MTMILYDTLCHMLTWHDTPFDCFSLFSLFSLSSLFSLFSFSFPSIPFYSLPLTLLLSIATQQSPTIPPVPLLPHPLNRRRLFHPRRLHEDLHLLLRQPRRSHGHVHGHQKRQKCKIIPEVRRRIIPESHMSHA